MQDRHAALELAPLPVPYLPASQALQELLVGASVVVE
jgi:hypothetical protein